MPTPILAFRLDAEKTRQLREVAALYGSPDASAFCRELVGVVVSGQPKLIAEFQTRLFTKMGEQLALDFTEKAKADAQKRAKKARTGRKRGRRPPKP